jgi:hypothetical protein
VYRAETGQAANYRGTVQSQIRTATSGIAGTDPGGKGVTRFDALTAARLRTPGPQPAG